MVSGRWFVQLPRGPPEAGKLAPGIFTVKSPIRLCTLAGIGPLAAAGSDGSVRRLCSLGEQPVPQQPERAPQTVPGP